MKFRIPQYLGLSVPLFLACSVAFADDGAHVGEISSVPAGLEISDSPTGGESSTTAVGILGPAAGIAQVIQAAAANASSSSLLDFSFARGADLTWDKLFTPSKEDSNW